MRCEVLSGQSRTGRRLLSFGMCVFFGLVLRTELLPEPAKDVVYDRMGTVYFLVLRPASRFEPHGTPGIGVNLSGESPIKGVCRESR